MREYNTGSHREYKHPDIDHTFLIKDIGMFEIEIDGIRVHRSDCDWMVKMANHGGGKTVTRRNDEVEELSSEKSIHDLALPFLQHILALKQKKGTI